MTRRPQQARPQHAVPARQASRFAFPFEQPAPANLVARVATDHAALVDWNKKQLGPVPAPRDQGRIDLAAIIGDDGVAEVVQIGELRFHTLGDSGHDSAQEAEAVAEEMATDFRPGSGALNPAFLLHLGDVVYGPSKTEHYGDRFYRPYRQYPGKIVAIPGNHDGEAKIAADKPSLSAFIANFCADTAAAAPQAAGSGIFRETMTLPGVYWMLDTPFVRIIGLYSNLLENPGSLQGRGSDGALDESQLDWLESTLQAIAADTSKALIIATHHPPYSAAGHAGSTDMRASIDAVCKKTGVYPHAFLSGHAHNYQRYMRRVEGRMVPYLVVGTGGMPPQKVPPATGQPVDGQADVTYDKAIGSLGYCFVSARKESLKIEFWQHGEEHVTPFDVVEVPI